MSGPDLGAATEHGVCTAGRECTGIGCNLPGGCAYEPPATYAHLPQRCRLRLEFVDGLYFDSDVESPEGATPWVIGDAGVTFREGRTTWIWPWHQIKRVRSEFYNSSP